MMNYQELIDQCQQEVANKYGWKKLVTGHKKSYFDEATLLLIEKLKSL